MLYRYLAYKGGIIEAVDVFPLIWWMSETDTVVTVVIWLTRRPGLCTPSSSRRQSTNCRLSCSPAPVSLTSDCCPWQRCLLKRYKEKTEDTWCPKSKVTISNCYGFIDLSENHKRKVTTRKVNKIPITQRLRTDLGRSVVVATISNWCG